MASGRFGFRVTEKVVEVESPRVRRQLALGGPWPFGGRTVPVELDAVAVGVAQVERLADAMVGSALKRDARGAQTAESVGERGAGRVEDREVVEAGRSGRRRRAAAALPVC